MNPEAVLNWMKKMPNYNEKMQEVLEECKNVEDEDR